MVRVGEPAGRAEPALERSGRRVRRLRTAADLLGEPLQRRVRGNPRRAPPHGERPRRPLGRTEGGHRRPGPDVQEPIRGEDRRVTRRRASERRRARLRRVAPHRVAEAARQARREQRDSWLRLREPGRTGVEAHRHAAADETRVRERLHGHDLLRLVLRLLGGRRLERVGAAGDAREPGAAEEVVEDVGPPVERRRRAEPERRARQSSVPAGRCRRTGRPRRRRRSPATRPAPPAATGASPRARASSRPPSSRRPPRRAPAGRTRSRCHAAAGGRPDRRGRPAPRAGSRHRRRAPATTLGGSPASLRRPRGPGRRATGRRAATRADEERCEEAASSATPCQGGGPARTAGGSRRIRGSRSSEKTSGRKKPWRGGARRTGRRRRRSGRRARPRWRAARGAAQRAGRRPTEGRQPEHRPRPSWSRGSSKRGQTNADRRGRCEHRRVVRRRTHARPPRLRTPSAAPRSSPRRRTATGNPTASRRRAPGCASGARRPGEALRDDVDERDASASERPLDEPLDERVLDPRRDDDEVERAGHDAAARPEQRDERRARVGLGRSEQLERAVPVAAGRAHDLCLAGGGAEREDAAPAPTRLRLNDRARRPVPPRRSSSPAGRRPRP